MRGENGLDLRPDHGCTIIDGHVLWPVGDFPLGVPRHALGAPHGQELGAEAWSDTHDHILTTAEKLMA